MTLSDLERTKVKVTVQICSKVPEKVTDHYGKLQKCGKESKWYVTALARSRVVTSVAAGTSNLRISRTARARDQPIAAFRSPRQRQGCRGEISDSEHAKCGGVLELDSVPVQS